MCEIYIIPCVSRVLFNAAGTEDVSSLSVCLIASNS